jgi:4-carboxymuconolactone decarboxylase
MARISFVEKEEATEEVQRLYESISNEDGVSVSNIFKALAHNPEGLEMVLAFHDKLFPSYKLDPQLRVLAYIKTSELKNCGPCVRRFGAFGRKVGLTQAQLDGIGSYDQSNVYSELEKLVLRYTEDLTTRAETAGTVMDGLKTYLSDRELVELNLTVGVAHMLNLFIKSFDIT